MFTTSTPSPSNFRLAVRSIAILWLVSTFLPTIGLAQGESGNVCVRDYRGGAVCTANDVRIEALNIVSVNETCVAGTPGETEVVFEALVSSAGSPDRYDIGLFLALDGGSARDGDSCYHDFLSGSLTSTPTYGDVNTDGVDDIVGGPWWDGDTDADSCGDIESNTQVFTTLPSLRFACIDNNGDGSADVSVCTTWDNNTGSACNTVVDAFPGTNSKCSCAGVELGIAPAPEITIVKSPATQAVASGGTANFSFTVTSKTTISNVVVSDPDCDAAPAFTGGDTNTDSILTPDETWTYTCSKTNVMAGFTNTVTVSGDGPLGPVMDTDTADVTISENPVIGVAKRVTSFSDVGGGDFDVGFQFVVENLGNVDLTNVQVVDDLTATFPMPVVFTIQAGPTAGGTLTANAGFDGNADQDLLDAGASSLAVGASATVDVTVRLTPNGASGPFSNTATASGTSPAMANPTDTSHDGTDPDPDGDGDPTEAGENDPTPISIVESPVVGVAKRVTSISDAGGGLFDVAFEMVVENLGNVALSNVQVADDLDATFPAPVIYSIQGGPTASGTLTANAGFDGSADQSLVDAGSSTLAIGASSTISFTVRFDPNGASGPFSNTATATGDGPGGGMTSDSSDDGTDPDPDGDGDPDEAGENDPTPVAVPENPVIGVAKAVTSLTDAGGGQFDVSLQFVVQNLGNVDLSNVQVTDDLDATFPAPVTYTIQAGPTAGGTLTNNGGFDGSADQNLLTAGSSALAVGATATIDLTVRFSPNGASGPFQNTAVASGDSPLGDPTTDTSDAGTDPDPDGDGNPSEIGEDDPTPIAITENPVIGVAKRVTSVTDQGGGVFDIGLSFSVENLGNVALSNVQVTDDLDAAFPAPVTYTVQAGPAAGATLTANGAFDGSADQNLLTAGSSTLALGASATVSLTVRITLNAATGPFSNTATANGTSPAMTVTTDTSDDGSDPDPNGNGDPDETGENDPTPISVTTEPILDADKSSSFDLGSQDHDGSGTLTPGDDLTYTLVITNTGTGDATDVVLDDMPDANTALLVGSVTTSQGTVLLGNTAGDTSVQVDVGTLTAGGGSVTISFVVTIDDPLSDGVTEILNQGVVSGSNFTTRMTDDPGTAPDDDPTVDTIASPTAPEEIPTLSEWMLLLLATLLAAGALRQLRRGAGDALRPA